METFSALLARCTRNSPVTGEFPAQRPVTRSFDVFCGLRLNKRLSKQSWGWWYETPAHPLWRHCYVFSPDFHTLGSGQKGRYDEDIPKCVFSIFNILIQMSLESVRNACIGNVSSLVQVMAVA